MPRPWGAPVFLTLAIIAATVPTAAAASQDLVIVDAQWTGGKGTSDVTKKLQALVQDNGLNVTVETKLFGNPSGGGSKKELTVTYEFQGERKTVVFKEKEKLS